MAVSAEERMNLATLQQTDPFIKCIKANAKHVTLYTFKADTNEWEKTDVEGTCFVYERSVPPYHGFMILNRLGTKNFIEPIVEGLEFQLKVPFLLYRNPPSIFGIWFYEAEECKSLADLLQRLVAATKEPVKPAPAPGADILKLLTKAQTDFVTKSEPPDMSGKPSHIGEMVKPQPVKPDHQQPMQRQHSITIDDLFKKASASSSNRQPSSQSRTGTVPKQSEQHVHTAFKKPLPLDQMTTVSELEREHTPDLCDPVQLLTPASLVGNAGLLPPQTQSLGTPMKNETLAEVSQSQLMSPMAFSVQSAARRDLTKTIAGHNNIPVAINPPQHVNMTGDSKLMSGFHYMRDSSRTISQSSDPVPLEHDTGSTATPAAGVSALTKEQLRQAMIHLLNTDQNFLDTLHSGYIQSLNATLRR